MNRTFVFFLICVFLACVGIDQLSKNYFFETILHLGSIGPFFFESHFNSGFVLQTLSHASVMSRVVFISSLYVFIFFGFFFLQSLLAEPLPALRIGLTLFFASITGNAFDRAFKGAVSDFVCLKIGNRLFYFNFADVIMWIGFAMILHSLYFAEHAIWHPNSKRKKYLVNTRYQFKWAFQSSLVTLSGTLILILFAYSFMVYGPVKLQAVDGYAFLFSASALGFLFSTIVFYAGVIISHRSAGPLYAFERFVEKLLQGEDASLTLRKTDEHQHLLVLASRLKEKLKVKT